MTESCCFLFVKQKTAYEMRISDWSSDVCSSDLAQDTGSAAPEVCLRGEQAGDRPDGRDRPDLGRRVCPAGGGGGDHLADPGRARRRGAGARAVRARSEEHTSELQSLMRISYAVFCLKKKKINH